MNDKQKQFLLNWIKENQYTGEEEPEWTPAQVVNVSGLIKVIEKL